MTQVELTLCLPHRAQCSRRTSPSPKDAIGSALSPPRPGFLSLAPLCTPMSCALLPRPSLGAVARGDTEAVCRGRSWRPARRGLLCLSKHSSLVNAHTGAALRAGHTALADSLCPAEVAARRPRSWRAAGLWPVSYVATDDPPVFQGAQPSPLGLLRGHPTTLSLTL